MEEKTIFIVALSVSIIGLAILFIITDELSVKEIDRIDTLIPDQEVTISGRISRLTQTDKIAFLDIAHENIEHVTVVLFKPREMALKEGDYVEIEGNVDDYEGKRQIIGNEVKVK